MKRWKPAIQFVILFVSASIFAAVSAATADTPYYTKEDRVPRYILNGLRAYAEEGYEQAVPVWLKDSPWANAAVLVSRIAYLKNIDKMYGPYQGYEILMTNETRTSQMTYVRFIFSRISGYALFVSQMRNNQWVLYRIDLHDRQKYAAAPPPPAVAPQTKP
jgi:hypothetical protein